MNIKILVSSCGCGSTDKESTLIQNNIQSALNELNLNGSIEIVNDFKTVMKYGVMKPPAIVINEKVVISGRLPKVNEIIKSIRINQK